MLPTPSTSHLNFANIYEPSEDSYLLLDTLSHPSQTSYLSARFPASSAVPLVLEVGPGSGVVIAFITAHAQTIFGRRDVVTSAVDVNEFACKGTAQTVAGSLTDVREVMTGGMFADCVRGDLGSCFREGVVDVCIFNPPYVPSEALPQARDDDDAFQRDMTLLALATDGGEDGMEITNKLLSQLDGLLSSRGVAYILLCAQNRPEDVKENIRAWGVGWTVETVQTSGKQGGWEKLHIVRIQRNTSCH